VQASPLRGAVSGHSHPTLSTAEQGNRRQRRQLVGQTPQDAESGSGGRGPSGLAPAAVGARGRGRGQDQAAGLGLGMAVEELECVCRSLESLLEACGILSDARTEPHAACR